MLIAIDTELRHQDAPYSFSLRPIGAQGEAAFGGRGGGVWGQLLDSVRETS